MADTITDDTSTTASIASNDVASVSSTIDSAGDADWFRTTLTAGYGYQIWVQGADSAQGTLPDPFLAVFNAAGNQLVTYSEDQSASIRDSFLYLAPATTGTYYLDAEGQNSTTGSYKMILERDALATTASAATATVNGVTTGQVGFGIDTADWMGIALTAGVNYQFDLAGTAGDGTSTLGDPWLALRAPDGTLLAADDDAGIGLNARVFYTPTVSGVYYLDAEESGVDAAGSYSLIVNSAPIDSTVVPGHFVAGVPVEGTIGFAGETNLHPVTFTAGSTYESRVTGETLVNPFLELLDASGSVIAFNDNFIGGNSYLRFVASESGTYYLAVRDSGSNSVGSYSVNTTSPGGTTMVEGDEGPNALSATSAGRPVAGHGGNDTLTGGAFNDFLDGGAGRDQVNFSGVRSAYTVDHAEVDTIVTGPDGTDTIRNTERLHFSNLNLAFDLDGNAGLVAKALGVLFGPSTVQVPQYVGIGISALDSGMTYNALLAAAIDFRLGAPHTHADFVNAAYFNLTGTLPAADVRAYLVGLIDSGVFTEVTMAAYAGDLSVNLANIHYAGLFQTGLDYV